MKRQRGKDGVSSATLAGRLPWHFANWREGCWFGGEVYTAEEGRRENRPEGYQCWITLDSVKERKQEIWGKVNLSLTPWPTTTCYPLQEASQTERRGGQREGRRLFNFILSEQSKKDEQHK